MDKRGHGDHARVVIETSREGAPHLLQPLATTGAELTSTQNRKLPQPLATTGAELGTESCRGSQATQGAIGETEMSEGAGSCDDVSGRWRVSVCSPRHALQRKEQEPKRGGSVQLLARSTKSVFLMVQISKGPLEA